MTEPLLIHYNAAMDQRAEKAFRALVDVVARLRAPDGCPWDREQTCQSAAPYLLEEAFEAAEAIDSHDPTHFCEELGDLLLQVVFQTQMVADTSGDFTIADVAEVVTEKLVRRHPHVFADTTVADTDEVLANWEAIKKTEKPQRASIFDGLPKGMPALLQAFRLGQKAGRVGFDWPDAEGVLQKIAEEVRELHDAQQGENAVAIEHEFGDILFTLAQLARRLDLDPEGALRRSNQRFQARFRWIEAQRQHADLALNDLTADEWDTLWDKAKKAT